MSDLTVIVITRECADGRLATRKKGAIFADNSRAPTSYLQRFTDHYRVSDAPSPDSEWATL
jgi:hypothetical protein